MTAQKYLNFAKLMRDHSNVSTKSVDCKTRKDLDAWLAMKQAPIKEFVPKMWQGNLMASLKKEYEQNLNRIKEANTSDTETTTAKHPDGEQTNETMILLARFTELHASEF